MSFNIHYHCVVVAPDGLAVDTDIYDAVLPAHDGLRGVLPGHAPLLCRLKPGILTYHDMQNPQKQRLFIEGGIAHIHPEKLTIITPKVIARDEMTFAQVEEILREAEAMVGTSIEEMNIRDAARERARLLLELVQKPS